MKLMILAGVVVMAAMAYVRVAPSDPARWHVMPAITGDADLKGGAIRVIQGGQGRLAALDDVIRTTPRTRHLAGAVDEGVITYITRSKLIGFPDYTTVQEMADGRIAIYGRLRFGVSDLGVNATRLDRWLQDLSSR